MLLSNLLEILSMALIIFCLLGRESFGVVVDLLIGRMTR